VEYFKIGLNRNDIENIIKQKFNLPSDMKLEDSDFKKDTIVLIFKKAR